MSVGIIAGNIRSMTIMQADVIVGSVASQNSEERFITVPGVRSGDIILPLKPTLTEGLVVVGEKAADDTIKIQVINATSGAIDGGTETFDFLIVRPETTDNYPAEVLK